jgi:hypothetical protein
VGERGMNEKFILEIDQSGSNFYAVDIFETLQRVSNKIKTTGEKSGDITSIYGNIVGYYKMENES